MNSHRPLDGTAITRSNGRLVVPDDPIIPFIEGDGTGPDIWRASVRVFDAAVTESVRRQAADRVDGSLRRRKKFQAVQQLAARRNGRRVPRIFRRDQRTADDAGRRRHPVAERRAAPVARPVRLPAAGALVPRRALAGEASRKSRHGDLPREHGRHLCRHRVRGRHRPKPRRCSTSSRRNFRRSSRRSASASTRRRPSGRRSSNRSARRSATSASRSASASSRSAISAPSGSCTARSATRLQNKRKSVTLVHKGNIMKFTEGAFRDWGYQVAKDFLRRAGNRRRPVVQDPGGQAGRRHRDQGCDRRHHAAAGADAA